MPLVETEPMDLRMARAILNRVEKRDHMGLISNPPLGYAEIAGFLGRVDVLIGMRTHSLILASSMHTPVASIIAYPKNRGYLQSIDREDGMLEFSEFTPANPWELVRSTWDQLDELRKRLARSVARERAKARAAALHLSDWLGPGVESVDTPQCLLDAAQGQR